MVIEIDFNSDEAIYMQVRNQIILGIATSRLREGDVLPSVRQLADTIGINMHTVNKAYSLLRQEGFVTIDRRRGTIISIDEDKIKEMKEEIIAFFNGNSEILTDKIEKRMYQCSNKLQYEKALEYREILDYIKITL